MVYLSYFVGQNNLRATREAKFEDLLFFTYNFHFVLHKYNYEARIHI